jgi:hypothetical protein
MSEPTPEPVHEVTEGDATVDIEGMGPDVDEGELVVVVEDDDGEPS